MADGETQSMAQKAFADYMADPNKDTIFSKIVSGDIPSKKVFESDAVLAFRDINPQAPVHVLVIPKRRIARLCTAEDSDAELLGQLMLAAKKVAVDEGLDKDGYRLVVNDGPHGLQSIYHLHVHVLGGKQLSWPPGC